MTLRSTGNFSVGLAVFRAFGEQILKKIGIYVIFACKIV